MKWHLGLLICVSTNLVFAESPACIGSNIAEWGNCRGSHIFPNGDKYVGGFVGGVARGQGAATTHDDIAVLAGDAGSSVQQNAAVIDGVAIAVGPQRDVTTVAAQSHVGGLCDIT